MQSKSPRALLLLTSSLPNFIRELANVSGASNQVTVLCPEESSGGKSLDASPGPSIYRFCYFWPRRFQRLAHRDGMPENLKRDWLARIQVPFFLLAQFLHTLRIAARNDLIHAHWLVPSGLAACLVKKMTGIKVVVTVHSSDLWVLMRSPWTRRLLLWILNTADAVTTVSELAKHTLCRLPISEPTLKKIRTVPIGIELPKGARLTQDTGDKTVILFMGRLVPIKGVDILIDALAGREDVELWVMGGGSERDRLERQAEARKVLVRFLGVLEGNDKTRAIQQSAFAVFPSRELEGGRKEGIPVSIMEIMAQGLPVIATRSGAIPELVEDEKNGLLCDPGDVEGLRASLQRMLLDVRCRERLGKEAKVSARRYGWDRVMSMYEEVYRSL